ncbi:MAG: multiheme c-type cytochrome [Acidobacteriota bacterium]
MKLAAGALGAAAALFAVTFAVTAATPSGSPGRQATPARTDLPEPRRLATSTPAGASDYLGSRACARCHQDDVDQWERSLHIQMTKPIAEADVVGDFTDGTRFGDHGRSFEFGRANGKPFMRIAFGSRKPETFSVDYTLGAKRYQGYLSRLADGRIYVLPAFWHLESRRWLDWKEITPIPDGAHDFQQIWNANCFNCHATNLAQGFDVATGRYDTTWTEMGIGCEACHGPGRAHVELMDSWEKDPALKPAYDNSATNRDLGRVLNVFSPRSAAPRAVYDTCAYCHGNKQNVFLGFRAGDRFEDYALPFLISAPIPANDLQGEFWPDGRPNRFNRPQALTLSGCFKAGEIACTNCHVAHGSRHPFSLKLNITQGRNGDLLCTQCHAPSAGASSVSGAASAPRASSVSTGDDSRLTTRLPRAAGPRADAAVPWSNEAIERHTFHRAPSSGSRCIGCHMSDVNWRLLIRRRDHTFQPPVPEVTAEFGVPNACTTCHDDRSPEWAARQMEQWWRDAARRQAALALADTMYRAGSGDATVLPALARLSVDRSQGMLVRASAVEFMQQLALGRVATETGAQSQTSFAYGPAPRAMGRARSPATLSHDQINALIGAASDPEPTVRAQAVGALVASGNRERVAIPLVARLIDTARVVRVRAAEGLLSLGIAELPGAAGQALGRAQEEFAAALNDFPDASANHTALGWLEAERNHGVEALRALDHATRLDPRAARPWVIRGIMAARLGQLDEAIAHWNKARSLEPDVPGVAELIAEAQRRKSGK